MPGEVHDYLLVLEAGDYFDLEVEQRGIDVGLSLFGPDDGLLLEMDLPIADLGVEPMLGVAVQSGTHRLRLQAWESEDAGGDYVISLVSLRRAGVGEQLRAQAARKFHEGEQLYWDGRYREALIPFQDSLERWRRAGDEFWQAESLDRIGSTYRHLGDWARAASFHEQAVAAFERQAAPRFLAVSLGHLATDCFELGEMERAIGYNTRVLALNRELGDRRGEGISLGALANIYKIQGETQKALDSFEGSLARLDRPEDRRYRAFQLHNLGTLYRQQGRREAALEQLRMAEREFAVLGEESWQASSLSQIGQLAFESGDTELALHTLRDALALRRQRKDRRGEAVALREIGSVLLASGDVEQARSSFLEALELLESVDSPRSKAALLTNLGDLHSRLGRGQEALDYYRAALEIYNVIGDPLGKARALLGVATAERQRGELQPALAAGRRALEIIEGLRLKPFSEELRVSFFAAVQQYFDFYIDLLMELDRTDPLAGHAALALQVNERARARSLLDLLSEAGAEIRDSAAPQLLEQERSMQRVLNRSVEVMEDEAAGETQRAAAAEAVGVALERLDAVRAAIRRQSPRYAALTQPPPLSVGEIQDSLLDADTVLLEYRLARERSYLWLLSTEELAAFELAPALAIESKVRAIRELLHEGPRRQSEGRATALLCELSRHLLQPAASRLGSKRLLIVADGALEYLPFGALPEPSSLDRCLTAEPLVVSHEIVHLPSASTLAALRRDDGRQSPRGTIAILADPVFGPDDSRVVGESRGSQSLVRAPAVSPARDGQIDSGPWPRLPQSRAEAEAILSLVPSEGAFRALDFDATKQNVVSGRLAGYRIVHFATHAVLNAEQPALSGIVLSQVDRRGEPVDGLLRAHEVYNLELLADLVVLSACETALGKQVRGEGLVGLPRGFMYAGSPRVIVSLWKVRDRATADLMKLFYRGLLVEGLAPAAALRKAQLTLRASRPHPYFWSGFIIQGEWRPAASIQEPVEATRASEVRPVSHPPNARGRGR